MTQEERLTEYARLREDSAREAAEYVQERQAKARHEFLEGAYGHAGIPPRFKGRSFDTFEAATPEQAQALRIARSYAARFEQALAHGTCLTMIGRPGTGKTHLAAAIGEALIDTGYAVLFRSLAGILRDFRACYRDGGPSETSVLQRMTEPDLLIVDEVGVTIGSAEKNQATLFDVFNARYEQRRPTLLLGNLTTGELREFLGERIERRIQEGGGPVVPFTWEPHETATF